MQITVTIPDEIAAQAKVRGLTPESYVENLVAQQKLPVSSMNTAQNRAELLAKLEKFFEDISVHSDKIPILPDEAYTRESFYSDHD